MREYTRDVEPDVNAPDVHRYLDPRAFLRDWVEARRAVDPSFSARAFSRLVGKSSPGLLAEFLDGRRLSARMVRAITKGLGLTGESAAFYEALVGLDQARSSHDRNAAWSRISASRTFREARRLDSSAVRYLSEWWIPVVKELSQRPDFRADADWISERIRPPITSSQAGLALETLTDLGLLVDDGAGSLVPAEAVVTTPHEVVGMAVHNYHRGMLLRALDALDGVASDERHFLAATVSVPHRAVAELKHELNTLQERILDLCGRYEGDAEEVMQVHLLLFPLTDRMGDP